VRTATSSLAGYSPAERHRAIATNFGRVIDSVTDWTRPTPVPEWVARDIVEHLLSWLPGFLASGGFDLPLIDATQPGEAWRRRSDAVQRILDDPESAQRDFDQPQAGKHPLAVAIDRFYTSDVFMHTWDLARSAECPHGLDQQFAATMLAGMEPLADALLASGHFGPPVPIDAGEDPVRRLMAFIGRNPDWEPLT